MNEFKYNADDADAQVALLEKCVELLESCAATSQDLREAQTAIIWTDDGKAAELGRALTVKYDYSVKWLEELRHRLDKARVNMEDAVSDTVALDDQQKAVYQNVFRAILGPIAPTII